MHAAIALIEESGPTGFSVNDLARDLGVTARAIRYRVGSRDALLVAVAEEVTATIALPPDDLGWDDWLRLTATTVRSALADRPTLIPIVLDAWTLTTRGAELAASSLDVLVSAADGNLATAVAAHNAFWAFVAGVVYSHAASPLHAADAGTVKSLSEGGRHGTVAALERLRASYAAAYPGVQAADVAFASALDVALAGVAQVIDPLSEQAEAQ